MADMIIILILVVILGAALSAMRKSRAKGVNCIGTGHVKKRVATNKIGCRKYYFVAAFLHA